MKNLLLTQEEIDKAQSWLIPMPDLALGQGSASGRPVSGESPIERLIDVFKDHASAESESLAQYRHLVAATNDPTVALLMRMVLEDEERHHDLLRRMAISLRNDLRWSRSVDDLPKAPVPAGAASAEMISTTKARILEEREGVRQLRRLARDEKHLYNGLFSLLLEVMAMDSEKHERILRFILRWLEAARRAEAEAVGPAT